MPRSVARANAGLVTVGAVAIVSLLLEHGVGLAPGATRLLWLVDLCCVISFALLQTAKLAMVPDARRYLGAHKIDYSLLFVLAVGCLAHLGLRDTPEYRYLASRGHPSPLWAFYISALQVYLLVIVGIRSTLFHRLLMAMRLHPSQMLVVSFLALVLGGTALLALPGATRGAGALPVIDALFTATSAVCVTGLVVRDTGTEFAPFGLSVILGLIQMGGLGMLTLTGALAVFGGSRLQAQERRALARVFDIEDARAMRRTLARVLLITAVIEGVGALLLYQFWAVTLIDPFTRAGWAVFHSVSAFCNAGFALFPANASLTFFVGDVWVLATVAVLVVLGGLGFGTVEELGSAVAAMLARRRRTPLSLQAKIALGMSAALVTLGAVGLFAMEAGGILRDQHPATRWLSAAFQSVSLRTAGFNSVDLVGMGLPAIALCCLWMLIGGSPGGTAGGMKTTTLRVLLPWPPRRLQLGGPTRRRAARLAGTYMLAFVAFVGIVGLLQREWSGRLAFEVASAMGTVGLSLGMTDELSAPAKVAICVAMFVGRVGPFALAASLLNSAPTEHSADEVQIG